MLLRVVYKNSGRARLDRFLAGEFSQISRAAVQKLIREGKVLVNAEKMFEKDYRLFPGDKVEVTYKAPRMQPRPGILLNKIYEDADILIIDKPAGLVAHPAPGQDKDSVAAAVLARHPGIKKIGGEFRPGIVHRLDAETSGLMVVAKTPGAYEFLKSAFTERRIVKYYKAMVHGKVEPLHGSFDLPIGRKTGEGKFRSGFGRPAKTEYWVEGYYVRPLPQPLLRPGEGSRRPGEVGPVDNYTLVRIQLHTGRTHQIRVHFSAAGHPVAGDRLYGGRFIKTDPKLFPRQFLHACGLKLELPDGREREFRSELPDDLKRSLRSLKKLMSSRA